MTRFTSALVVLIGLACPMFLVSSNIRLFMTPQFLAWEYSKADFPEDPFGFSREERLIHAYTIIEFLSAPDRPEEAIRILRRQTYLDSPLYDRRELNHLVDVKRRTDVSLWITWAAGLTLIGSMTILATRSETQRAALKGLFYGAVLTIAIVGSILAFMLLGWCTFFDLFHKLLFAAGTYSFASRNTLIRLFPGRFWFDVGVLLSVGTLVQSILITTVAALVRLPSSYVLDIPVVD